MRFADDAVLCFQYKEDAEKVMEVLPKRFAKYGLTLHPEKTRLLESSDDLHRGRRRGRGRNLTRSISSATPTSVPAAGEGNSQCT
jgi:RNA-directed DNA polymerase